MEESKDKSKVWYLIKPEARMEWDMFVFLVIVVATFEIPYNLLVGYDNEMIMRMFNLLFYLVFGLDMLFNAFP